MSKSTLGYFIFTIGLICISVAVLLTFGLVACLAMDGVMLFIMANDLWNEAKDKDNSND